MKILVVNPNSSESMTKSVESSLQDVILDSTDFWTAPSFAPKEITNRQTMADSCLSCLPILKEKLADYDGMLIACYSNHPLASDLWSCRGPVIENLFTPSIDYVQRPSPRNFAILTSNREWFPILTDSVQNYFSGGRAPNFCGVHASDVNVLGLQHPENFSKIVQRINDILSAYNDTEVILLGCVGFSGLVNPLTEVFPHLEFVDCVAVGYRSLVEKIKQKSS